MEKINNITFTLPNGEIEEIVVIKNEDGSETSMSKAYYEAQQVEHLTEKIPPA
jgi:hypothetical protein